MGFTEAYPGVISAAKNWEEMKGQFAEAIEFHFEGLAEEVQQDF